MDVVSGLARWIHFLAGIMWIGMLYFFNFVNAPAMAEANKEGNGGVITKHIMPRALAYFRWGAVLTWIAGAALAGPWLGKALLLQPPYAAIGMGAWLGTIMLLNVWGIIWRNQKKLLGLTPATDEEKTRARRIAFLASRVNTMLSIPMLFFMANGFTHKSAVGL